MGLTPEDAIRRVLEDRQGTACPSEAARLVDPDGWRDHMAAVREAAAAMADRGELDVTQGDAVVDVRRARGPVRLRPRR